MNIILALTCFTAGISLICAFVHIVTEADMPKSIRKSLFKAGLKGAKWGVFGGAIFAAFFGLCYLTALLLISEMPYELR